jgi:hypothetical protein
MKKLFSVQSPDKSKPSMAPIDKSPRGPRKRKSILHQENQPDIDKFISQRSEKAELVIIPNEPPVINGVQLEQEE